MYPRKERSDFAPKKIAAGDTSLLKKSETSGTSRAPSPTNGENTLFVCRGEQRSPLHIILANTEYKYLGDELV